MATGGHVTVAVVCEIVAHDHGHWCRTCALATGIRAWVMVRIGHTMGMQVRAWCEECGGRDIEIDPDGRHC
jgi:hypothetical protein